jgi:hypothetical protein
MLGPAGEKRIASMKAFKQAAAEAASDGADASLSPMIAAQRSLIAELRDADWLTPERARAWCRILAAMFLVATVLVLALSRNGLDPLGNPLGTDFVSFWSASRLALDGQAAAVYEPAAHLAAQRALFPALQPSFYYAFFTRRPSCLFVCLWHCSLILRLCWCGSQPDLLRCSLAFAAYCHNAGQSFPLLPSQPCC